MCANPNRAALLLLALLTASASCARPAEYDGPAPGGKEGPRRDLKVFGGARVFSQTRFPYFVSIRSFEPEDAMTNNYDSRWPNIINSQFFPHKCGGVLLTPPQYGLYQFVLTAASCVNSSANPLVIIGTNTLDTGISERRSTCWQQEACDGNPSWPQIRTTYASVMHPSWRQAGGEFDLALLVLNSQALATSTGTCGNQCIKLADARPADGSPLTLIGLGANTWDGRGSYSAYLEEAAVTIMARAACETARNPPTEGRLARIFATLFQNPTVTANMMCTSNADTGTCYGDAGSPLVFKSTTGASLDRLVGIAADITQQCDSALDPSVYTDITKAATWITNIMNSYVPIPNTTNFLVPRTPTSRPVYGYSMRIFFVNKDRPAEPIPCTNSEEDVNLQYVAGKIAVSWSEDFLAKGYWDSSSRTSYRTINGRPNAFGVDIHSCKDGQLKIEWSSNRGYDVTKAAMDALLAPSNDPTWARGARYVAYMLRCRAANLPSRGAVINRFLITTGKGAWQKVVGNYAVDLTGWPGPTPC